MSQRLGYRPSVTARVPGLRKPSRVVADTCSRCGGVGGWEGWPGWTCYRCGGNGVDPTSKAWGFPADWTDDQISAWWVDHDAKVAERRAKVAIKRESEREARVAQLLADCPEIERIGDLPNLPDFAQSIIAQARSTGRITDNQLAALVKAEGYAIERQAREVAEQAQPHLPCPTGRQTITGEILSTKWQEAYHPGGTGTLKMLVRDDRGFKVYVTAPGSLGTIDRGDRVTLTCEVTPSDDDALFGFGKRPTKASLLDHPDTSD